MKKLLLALSLIFILGGCSWFNTNLEVNQNFNTKQQPTLNEKTEPVKDTTDSAAIEQTQLAYQTQNINEETDLYLMEIQYPAFDNCLPANQEIKKYIDQQIADFKETATEVFEPGMKNSLYIDYSVTQANEEKISIAFEISVYSSGAAHPNSFWEAFNYDIKLNKPIDLVDLFIDDSSYLEALSMIAKDKIMKQKADRLMPMAVGPEVIDEMLAETEEWVDQGTAPDPENFQVYTLTSDAITFYFDPYSVGPYAEGGYEVEIPFADIAVLLKQ